MEVYCKKHGAYEIAKGKCRCGCNYCAAWWNEDRGVIMITIGDKNERVCYFCHCYVCICDDYDNSNEDWDSDDF
jgi:hypothetical protein